MKLVPHLQEINAVIMVSIKTWVMVTIHIVKAQDHIDLEAQAHIDPEAQAHTDLEVPVQAHIGPQAQAHIDLDDLEVPAHIDLEVTVIHQGDPLDLR